MRRNKILEYRIPVNFIDYWRELYVYNLHVYAGYLNNIFTCLKQFF